MTVGNWGYVTSIRGNDDKFHEGWVFMKNLKEGLQFEIVSNMGLNLRKTPVTSSDDNIIRTISKGEIVTFYKGLSDENWPGNEYWPGDGHGWIRVKYGEYEGWICYYYYDKNLKKENNYAEALFEW